MSASLCSKFHAVPFLNFFLFLLILNTISDLIAPLMKLLLPAQFIYKFVSERKSEWKPIYLKIYTKKCSIAQLIHVKRPENFSTWNSTKKLFQLPKFLIKNQKKDWFFLISSSYKRRINEQSFKDGTNPQKITIAF